MKKIISLFQRDYEGTRQVYDEIVPGAEWVIAGEGVATVKYDGTCCMVRDGKLYKRYDRKMTKSAWKRKKSGYDGPWSVSDFKPEPEGWEAAEPEPNEHTGHWPGWLPVGNGPEDQWHREVGDVSDLDDGTYELVGPKIGVNPYRLTEHELWRHGTGSLYFSINPAPRDFDGLRQWFARQNFDNPKLMNYPIEGIVWHHPDGRMVKIKRRDFGLDWPVEHTE